MIINDLQRLRWQILDEALRDPVTEYFMGERTKTNEVGNTRSLIHYVNTRLKSFNRNYSCSKRMLQNDVAYFIEKGARIEPRFRRGHKRILRYINLEWKNPLLRPAVTLGTPVADGVGQAAPVMLDGPLTPVTLRLSGGDEALMQRLGQPDVMMRQTDVKAGTVTIQVEVPAGQALMGILLSYGADLEVLAPESMRENIRQTVNTLQKLYKKETTAKKEPQQQSLFGDLF